VAQLGQLRGIQLVKALAGQALVGARGGDDGVARSVIRLLDDRRGRRPG
jgi:hypothetical protein